jgi:competence protein ComEA
MNPGRKYLLEWFGYSRRERRSTFILFIILIVVIALRYLIQPPEIEIEDLSKLLASADTGQTGFTHKFSQRSGLFNFDPNEASFDTLTLLGLSEKQARTLVNYRNSGGRFRYASDIKKIYGIDDQTAATVMPYIVFETGSGKNTYYHSDPVSEQEISNRLDLNRCDSASLVRLPGLGPVLSSRIIKFRKLLGGFASVDQLKEVYGLKDTTFNNLKDRVFADSSAITGIKINDVGFRELARHPYLERYEIESIIKYKELKGRFSDITELVDNKILSVEKAKRLSPYLKF